MTSNIKEYIQGCISVWFSYKVGNVKRGSCRAGALFQPVTADFSLPSLSAFLCGNFDIIARCYSAVNDFFNIF